MRFLQLLLSRRRVAGKGLAGEGQAAGAVSDRCRSADSGVVGAASRGGVGLGRVSAAIGRSPGTLLCMMALALALLTTVGLRGVSGEAKPVRVEPRRHSGYWPAYIVYSFKQYQYASRAGERGSVRMYYMLPTLDAEYPGNGNGNRMFTYRELLDRYRVSPEQFNRIPKRVPEPWLDEHMARLLE